MQGPQVIASIIPTYSGRTPLYTSKNSSAVGLSKVNISIADISNPSYKMKSIILPANPSYTICGLIMQHVQLLNTAGVPKFEEKYYAFSLSKSETELEEWIAFLKVSEPN